MMATARKWMWLTMATTLVIGMGVGVLVDRMLLLPTVSSNVRGPSGEGRHGRHRDHADHARRMVERLSDELDLDQEQTEVLAAVVNKNHETAQTFWRESRREFEALREQFRTDVRATLTDEQKVRFDELVESMREKRGDSYER